MPQLNPEFFVSQLFWLVVTFSFLLIFLWRISLPRIGSVLDKRERKISEDLATAKKLQAEAENIQEQIDSQLIQARSQATNILKQTSNSLQNKAEEELESALTLAQNSYNDPGLAYIYNLMGIFYNRTRRKAIGVRGINQFINNIINNI